MYISSAYPYIERSSWYAIFFNEDSCDIYSNISFPFPRNRGSSKTPTNDRVVKYIVALKCVPSSLVCVACSQTFYMSILLQSRFIFPRRRPPSICWLGLRRSLSKSRCSQSKVSNSQKHPLAALLPILWMKPGQTNRKRLSFKLFHPSEVGKTTSQPYGL